MRGARRVTYKQIQGSNLRKELTNRAAADSLTRTPRGVPTAPDCVFAAAAYCPSQRSGEEERAAARRGRNGLAVAATLFLFQPASGPRPHATTITKPRG